MHNLTALRRYLLRMKAAGHTELQAPLPVADRDSGGSTGDFYSDERLLEIANELYHRVVVGYRFLVERWLPTLAPQLEHYALPLRIVGFVSNAPGGLIGPVPQMGGYLEALPEGSNDDVAISFGGFDFSIAERVYLQQRAARPLAARWITGTIGSMSFEVGERYPVSDAVYDWLAHDLQRIGLIGAGAITASREAFTPWDEASDAPAKDES